MQFLATITVEIPVAVEGATSEAAAAAARTLADRFPAITRGGHVAAVTVAPMPPADQGAQEYAALQDMGGDQAVARWVAGLLPETDLLHHVRARLFAGFDAVATKRQPMRFWSIPHLPPPRCNARNPVLRTRDANDWVRWSTHHNPALTRTTADALERILGVTRELASHPWLAPLGAGAVSYEVRKHTGACTGCSQTAEQTSVLVTVLWAGRPLSREYLL